MIVAPRCYFCQKECVPMGDEESDYCYGCGQYVCEDCNKNYLLMGPHDVSDHIDDPGDDS